MDYLELTVALFPREPWSGVLIAQLAENGYESFVETDDGLIGYAKVDSIDLTFPVKNTFLSELHAEVKFRWTVDIIKQQNWNAEWESQFDPVYVEDYLTILAPFHDRSIAKGMVVEIMPKMSFGTGHHQTTWMMSKSLFELEKMPEKILDMGTGTGVLAIISEKLGAKEVMAVVIENWSVENAIENAERNHCRLITTRCGDIDMVNWSNFDLIIANINKNVLKKHMIAYAALLKKGGLLFLSGFFMSDTDELLQLADIHGFQKLRILTKDNWAAIQLQLSCT
jgi:ribosomal protein L11 methyltransferase